MHYESLVLTLLNDKNLTSESLKDAQRAFSKAHQLATLPSKSQILQAYFQLLEQEKIEKNPDFELLLRKRAIRSLSGIVPIQVLTKPFPCPSRCIFCPNDPEMPKSYIKSEPWAMRAFLNQFDPIKQVYNRLYSLKQTGHKTDKIEMIVLGGTWDFYPRDYKLDFIKQLYDACNTFDQLEIRSNEKSPLAPLWERGEMQKQASFSTNEEMQKQTTSPFSKETVLNKVGKEAGGECSSKESLEEASRKIDEKKYHYLSIRGDVGFFDAFEAEKYIKEQHLITSGSLPYHLDAKKKAQLLRKNPTSAEKKLWTAFLQDIELNVYRQKPIDHFIADFYIPACKLVIELDWKGHQEHDQSAYDLWRDEVLETYGLVVVRIKNADLESHFHQVIEELKDLIFETSTLKTKLEKDSPSFSKRGLGGDSPKKASSTEWKYAFEIANQDQIQLSTSLEEAIHINETAQHRIIGLTIETRPEFVTDQNCQDWRAMGVTRIEMGVQSTDDQILDLNKRGHHLAEVEKALHKLRQYAFKFSIHIMPWLYGSTLEKDLQTFRDIYENPYLKPDEIKFYPTSVIPNTELYDLYQQGKYQPITTEEISEIITTTFREIIPPYTRIKRLIRDIPATEISAGSNVTNLSQLMHEKLLKTYQKADSITLSAFYARLYENLQVFSDEEEFFSVIANGTKWSVAIQKNDPTGLLRFARKDTQPASFQTYLFGQKPELSSFRHFVSLDTRSREMRNKKEKTDFLNLVVRAYESSVGKEYFISYEDGLGYLYGFTRLLLPWEAERIDLAGLGLKTALIRELHVYGSLQGLKQDEEGKGKVQHTWLGKQLLKVAETIAQKSDFSRLSVISGVGVREYYRKQGYELEGTYMVKEL